MCKYKIFARTWVDVCKIEALPYVDICSEQKTVRAAVHKLGGFTVVDRVQRSTTHIVCGGNRRTVKVLMGIARGCWIVSLDWVSQ